MVLPLCSAADVDFRPWTVDAAEVFERKVSLRRWQDHCVRWRLLGPDPGLVDEVAIIACFASGGAGERLFEDFYPVP